MSTQKRVAVSFYITEQYRDLLDEIAYRNRSNMSEMVRQFIDEAAVKEGLTPIGAVDVEQMAVSK